MMCQQWVISLIISEALESTPFDSIHSLFHIHIWPGVISQADDWQNTYRTTLIDSSQ